MEELRVRNDHRESGILLSLRSTHFTSRRHASRCHKREANIVGFGSATKPKSHGSIFFRRCNLLVISRALQGLLSISSTLAKQRASTECLYWALVSCTSWNTSLRISTVHFMYDRYLPTSHLERWFSILVFRIFVKTYSATTSCFAHALYRTLTRTFPTSLTLYTPLSDQALEKYNIEKDIAAYIKKEFDKKYNPTWHCIVGRNFGTPHHSFSYYVLCKSIVLCLAGQWQPRMTTICALTTPGVRAYLVQNRTVDSVTMYSPPPQPPLEIVV